MPTMSCAKDVVVPQRSVGAYTSEARARPTVATAMPPTVLAIADEALPLAVGADVGAEELPAVVSTVEGVLRVTNAPALLDTVAAVE